MEVAHTARITDLCDEDKARIAKLIQQLVKVGSENERVQKELLDERKVHGSRMEGLMSQNHTIVKETASDMTFIFVV